MEFTSVAVLADVSKELEETNTVAASSGFNAMKELALPGTKICLLLLAILPSGIEGGGNKRGL